MEKQNRESLCLLRKDIKILSQLCLGFGLAELVMRLGEHRDRSGRKEGQLRTGKEKND